MGWSERSQRVSSDSCVGCQLAVAPPRRGCAGMSFGRRSTRGHLASLPGVPFPLPLCSEHSFALTGSPPCRRSADRLRNFLQFFSREFAPPIREELTCELQRCFFAFFAFLPSSFRFPLATFSRCRRYPLSEKKAETPPARRWKTPSGDSWILRRPRLLPPRADRGCRR